MMDNLCGWFTNDWLGRFAQDHRWALQIYQCVNVLLNSVLLLYATSLLINPYIFWAHLLIDLHCFRNMYICAVQLDIFTQMWTDSHFEAAPRGRGGNCTVWHFCRGGCCLYKTHKHVCEQQIQETHPTQATYLWHVGLFSWFCLSGPDRPCDENSQRGCSSQTLPASSCLFNGSFYRRALLVFF